MNDTTKIDLHNMTEEALRDLISHAQAELQSRTAQSRTAQTVRIRWEKFTSSGRRESWARTVTGIDESVRGAKAFRGDYLEDGEEIDLPLGSLVIVVVPTGSVKNGSQEARLCRVEPDGLARVFEADWRREFLTFRDQVRDALTARGG